LIKIIILTNEVPVFGERYAYQSARLKCDKNASICMHSDKFTSTLRVTVEGTNGYVKAAFLKLVK